MSDKHLDRSEPLFKDLNYLALRRECQLVRHLIGSGVTALGRANYADHLGDYYNAFFGLSVGIERLAKLILVADHIIKHNGQAPEQKLVRKYGHELTRLIEQSTEVQAHYGIKMHYNTPPSDIPDQIVLCLNSFADARRGRYANFSSLADQNTSFEFEPIRHWWAEVASRILQSHYYGKAIQRRVEHNAMEASALIGNITFVRHINESGELMNDVYSASLRTGQTEIVKTFGRYYSLIIIRNLSVIFIELSRHAGYDLKLMSLFGLYEYFTCYATPDSILKRRRIWPI